MDNADAGICSFVIRTWIEEPGNEARSTTWRGHITHVASGERSYFQDLHQILIFIRPYLEQQGVWPDEIN